MTYKQDRDGGKDEEHCVPFGPRQRVLYRRLPMPEVEVHGQHGSHPLRVCLQHGECLEKGCESSKVVLLFLLFIHAAPRAFIYRRREGLHCASLDRLYPPHHADLTNDVVDLHEQRGTGLDGPVELLRVLDERTQRSVQSIVGTHDVEVLSGLWMDGER